MIYVWNQRRQLRRHHRHHHHRQQQQQLQQQPIVSFIKLGFKSNVKRAIPIWAPIIFSIQICHSLSRSLAFFNLFYLKLITRTSTKPSSIADKREQLPTKSYNIHHQWSESTVNVDIHLTGNMETEQQQQQQQQPNGQQVQSAQTTPQSMASNHTSTNSSEVVTHDGSYDQDL